MEVQLALNIPTIGVRIKIDGNIERAKIMKGYSASKKVFYQKICSGKITTQALDVS